MIQTYFSDGVELGDVEAEANSEPITVAIVKLNMCRKRWSVGNEVFEVWETGMNGRSYAI